jgi:hypothetical protein
MKPTDKRDFHAFISYRHYDQEIVDKIDFWLTEIAGFDIWLDRRNLPPSSKITSYLPMAIENSRAIILILSKQAVSSGWIKEEYDYAIAQRAEFPDFRIIPIVIEDCEIPRFIQTTKWIELKEGKLEVQFCQELITALTYRQGFLNMKSGKDIYISRSWRQSETEVPDNICIFFHKAGFRLIGDTEDQKVFDKKDRIPSIISSCGGLLAILPNREETSSISKYMLQEIQYGIELGLKCIVYALDGIEERVDIPQNDLVHLIKISLADLENDSLFKKKLEEGEELMEESWRDPPNSHYIFLSTRFSEEFKESKEAQKNIIETITSMPCVIGDEIRTGSVQNVITDKIKNAYAMISDISDDNINTSIEAGIGIGAGKRLHLMSLGPRKSPPFMFRNQQVWTYEDNISLIGLTYKLIHPYRRRILNNELPENKVT